MIKKPLGPGPGAYGLPSTVGYDKHDARKKRLPQFSFGAQLHLKEKSSSPGPKYQVNHLTRYGPKKSPAFSLYPRIDIKERSRGPGPAARNIDEHPVLTGKRPPAYSMSGRDYFEFKNCAPAPNAYSFGVQPVKPGIPAYSLGMITGLSAKPRSPGPATYGRTDLNVCLKKSPEYSMKPHLHFKFKTYAPGPNYYNLMEYKPGDKSYAYSFGTKHNQYAPPMIVGCDNA